MEIKKISKENWKNLRDLYLALLKSDPEAFVDEYEEISARTEEEWIKSLGKRGATFVAIEDGAYVAMGRINFYDELPGVPVLHKLGVLSEYRGKGIATQLLGVQEKWAEAEGAKKMRLYVIADRSKTIAFYEKSGWKIVETLKENSQRKDGSLVDVVIMEKDLG
jgi:GNAT superfamily N-acetyltransferase